MLLKHYCIVGLTIILQKLYFWSRIMKYEIMQTIIILDFAFVFSSWNNCIDLVGLNTHLKQISCWWYCAHFFTFYYNCSQFKTGSWAVMKSVKTSVVTDTSRYLPQVFTHSTLLWASTACACSGKGKAMILRCCRDLQSFGNIRFANQSRSTFNSKVSQSIQMFSKWSVH